MSNVIHQMMILFLLMLVGFIANKTNVMDTESNKKVSKLVINITSPAIIIYSVAGSALINKSELIVIFLIAISPFVVFPIIAKGITKLFKIPQKQKGTFEVMLIYSNMGFMGIPVISGIYGTDAIFYVSIFMMIFNISFFSYGVSLLRKKDKSEKVSLKRIINPGVVAATTGLIIFLLEIPLPSVLTETLGIVGNVTTPLAMIIVGSTIAEVSIKEVFMDWKIYIYTILRLLILPIVMWLFLRNFIANETLLGVAVLLMGMPTAANILMACNEYGGDGEFVSRGIFLTSVGSLLSIPLLVSLIG